MAGKAYFSCAAFINTEKPVDISNIEVAIKLPAQPTLQRFYCFTLKRIVL